MTTTVDTRMLARWLERCAETVEAARGELCALDGEVGDGDHGSSMADGLAAAARAAAHAAARCDGDAGPKAMMDAAGSAFIAAVGATVGPLYATAFFRAGAAVDAGGGVPDLLAAMVDGISARGKARPGDCTMIDAWDPAARAAAAGAAAGQDPPRTGRRRGTCRPRGGRRHRVDDRIARPCGPAWWSLAWPCRSWRTLGAADDRGACRRAGRPAMTEIATDRTESTRVPLRFGEDALLWAAWLYYEEGLTQNEVAQAMGVSRPTVNAYLADARAGGVVNVSIAGDRMRSLSLAREVSAHFGLDDCLVVPSTGGERSLIDRLGAAGAQALAWHLRPGASVGITWGRTMLSLAAALPPDLALSDMRVVQATGGTTARIPHTPEACASLLAERLGARCIPISAPAILTSPEARDMLLAEPVVAEQMAELARIDTIVFGTSSLRPNSTIHTSGFFDSALQRHDAYHAAVGSVAGRFVDGRGRPVIGPLEDRTISIALAALARVRTRIAVAGGFDKVPAILGLLRGGFANVLVTDAQTALGCLRAEGKEPDIARTVRRRPGTPQAAGEGNPHSAPPERLVKKLQNDPRDVVVDSIAGALAAFPDRLIAIDGADRALRTARAPTPGKVGLVIGGGAGHEPAFLGYVGPGLADAVAVGNVFASPPPDRVLRCTRAADAGAGVLYIYGNYTGDVMNFDMAAELAAAEGIDVRTVLTTDDVASSPASDRDGRRGTAGNVFVYKIAGAACDRMLPLAECERLARAANANCHTMGIALEPCSLPETRKPSFALGPDDVEVGVGIHGEPGIVREPAMSADAATDLMMDRLIGEARLEPGSRVALLVNSLGSTPMIELFILARRAHQRLAAREARVHLSLVGHYCTSLDMTGASISLLTLDAELTELLDAPCDGFAWIRG